MRISAQISDGGQTLLEMLIVLVIIGLVAAAGTWALKFGLGAQDMRREIAVLESALAAGRQESINSGRPIKFQIDEVRGSLRIGNREFKPGRGFRLMAVDSTNASGNLYFPDGSATPIEIALEQSGIIRRFQVNWATGELQDAGH